MFIINFILFFKKYYIGDLLIKLVVFDLDNVLIDGETVDEIAKIKGVEDEIGEITLKAMQGKIPFETSIRERIKKLEGTSVEDIEKNVVQKIPLNEGAKETAEQLKKDGYKIAIITGSFEKITLRVKEEINADYAYSNKLGVKDGKLTGEVSGPLITGDKIDVLRELLEKENMTLDECVAIGDGANDLEMVKNAKIGIAFNAKPILKENADRIINKKDLRKVLDIMVEEQNITEKEENVEESKTEEKDVENMSFTESLREEEAQKAEAEESEDKTEEAAEEPEATEEVAEESEATEKSEVAEETTEEEEVAEEKPVIDYEKLNFSQLLECKRTLEAELTELKNVRDNMNDQTKEYRKERDELNQELKDTLKVALEKRNERDEINKEVHKYKGLRNESNEELKKIEWSSGKKDIANIEAEIKKIDKTIQTKVLDIRKENELVKRVSDLTKKLKKIQEDEEQEKAAEDLKEKSEEYHQQVVELSDKAQSVHEEMIEYFNQIDGIREKADGKHQDFVNSRKAATAKHEEVKAKLSEIKKVNKLMDQSKAKSKGGRSNNKGDNKDMKEKELAEETFQKFKDGKKLTTEEFLLLQKYNIM